MSVAALTKHLDSAHLLELQQLAAAYWARADGHTEISIADLFVEDAVLILGALRLAGRSAIERFFVQRDDTQRVARRCTRHFACNHRIASVADRSVVMQSLVVVYAGMGTLPLPTALPAGIADFEDTCVLDAGERWMFSRREGRTVFVGSDAPSFARS